MTVAATQRQPALTVPVIGAGLNSCGRLVQGSSSEWATYLTWAEGWATGYASALTETGTVSRSLPRAAIWPMTAGQSQADVAAARTFLQHYCEAHPLDNVAAAVHVLIEETGRHHGGGGEGH